MNIVIIVQARMGSTRLPGKMMKVIAGRPVIQHVVERARRASASNAVWLATTKSPADDILAAWTDAHQVPCYRGSEDDVLDRYYQAAQRAKADVIVRVTGDCPLHDPQVIDLVINEFVGAKGAYDYVSNTNPPTYPDGLDVEVFSFATLAKAWREAKLKSEREHVTPYIYKHPDQFRLKNVTHTPDLSAERWTLDTRGDFDFLSRVIGAGEAGQRYGSLPEVRQLIERHPEWRTINAGQVRNEGYLKSVSKDG